MGEVYVRWIHRSIHKEYTKGGWAASAQSTHQCAARSASSLSSRSPQASGVAASPLPTRKRPNNESAGVMVRSSGALAAACSSAMVPQAASSAGSCRMKTGLLSAPAAAPPLLVLSLMASLAYAKINAWTGWGTNARQSSSKLQTSAQLKGVVGVVDDALLVLPPDGWRRRTRKSAMTSAFDSKAGQRSAVAVVDDDDGAGAAAAGASAMVID